MNNLKQLKEWYSKYENLYNEYWDFKFEEIENKFNESRQVSAIVFLASKLKNKKQEESFYYYYGQYTVNCLACYFKDLEDFTEEEIKSLIHHGIFMNFEKEIFYIELFNLKK